jgi:hypothetical protein
MVCCKFFGPTNYNQVPIRHLVHHKNSVQLKLLDQVQDKFVKTHIGHTIEDQKHI